MATSPPQLNDSQKSALVQQIITGSVSLQDACEQQGLSTDQLKQWVRLYRRVVRQAIDQQLHNTLSLQGLEIGELSRGELSGNLADIGVADLLQTVQMGRKHAHITVAHGDELSEIWCRDGEVIDARSGSLRGEAAFYRILSIERGRVVADFAPTEHERGIDLDTPRLLLKAAGTNGLRERVMRRLGDPTEVFRIASAGPEQLGPVLNDDEREVLGLFDGVRSVEEAIFASRLPDARALEIVASLRERNLLVVKPPSERQTARGESPPPSSNLTMTYRSFVGSAISETGTPSVWLLASGAVLCSCLGAVTAIVYANALAPVHGNATLAELAPIDDGSARPLAQPLASQPTAALGLPAPQALLGHAPSCPPHMAWIASGAFDMGSNSKRPALSLARPAHRVSIDGFCLDVHEVTAADYAACSDRGACTPAHRSAHFAAETQEGSESDEWLAVHGAMCNAGKPERVNHPVNCVSHDQAARYCAAGGARLPSEAEWEFAARGTHSLTYPWGNGKPTGARVNACGKECERWHIERGLASEVHGVMYRGDDGYAGTAPVGSFPLGSTPEGIEDLIGNVFEWTSGGLYEYQDAAESDPKGPPNAESFVIRGGNFNSGIQEFADPALRFAMHRDSYSHGVGFRCAADAPLASGAPSTQTPASGLRGAGVANALHPTPPLEALAPNGATPRQ